MARHRHAFDPYPFILLNLVLSMIAALQAPVILMAQNRLAAKDRLDAAPRPAPPARRRAMRHEERHRTDRISWLRAAVLGANDGVVSTASLLLGVASANATRPAVLLAGTAGLVAAAMSMAAGEYVSVSSQADTERADIARERGELASDAAGELAELTGIYVERGLTPELAAQVARELTAHDALAAHARDELGITHTLRARPVQAAFASALAFATGAAVPLVVAVLGSVAAWCSVSRSRRRTAWPHSAGWRRGPAAPRAPAGTLRVLWGALAMAITAAIRALTGTRPG